MIDYGVWLVRNLREGMSINIETSRVLRRQHGC